MLMGAHLVPFHRNIASHAAAWANGLGFRQIPHAAFETKICIRQRTHRTNVDDIARIIIVQLFARINIQLRMVPAIENTKFAGFADIISKTHTTRA